MGEQFTNNASTTLASSATNVATTISVTSSTPFPTATQGGQFRILVDSEYMIVTAISGTTWTVTRGAEGSTAAAHSLGATVTHVVTAGALNSGPWGGGDYFRTGYYHLGMFGSTATTSVSIAAGAMYSAPFFVPVRRSFDRIAAQVSTGGAAGAVLRMGIYSHTAGVPAALLVDAGTADSTVAQAVEISISVTLDPGIYWLAAAAQTAGCSVRGFASQTAVPWSSGIATSFNPSRVGIAYYTRSSGVTGALPSTFSYTSDSNTPPLIALRAA